MVFNTNPNQSMTQVITSQMIHYRRASLSKQHTADVLFCHGTQQDCHCLMLPLAKSSQKVGTYHKLYTVTFLQSRQLLWLHMNRLSFMLKIRAESFAITSAVYAWPGLTWSDVNPVCIICTVHGQPAFDDWSVDAMTNKKKVAMRTSTWAIFAPGSRRCTLAVALHYSSPTNTTY